MTGPADTAAARPHQAPRPSPPEPELPGMCAAAIGQSPAFEGTEQRISRVKPWAVPTTERDGRMAAPRACRLCAGEICAFFPCARPQVSGHAAWRALLRLGCGSDQVIAETDERGLRLNRARCEQDLITPPRIGPFLAQRPARAPSTP